MPNDNNIQPILTYDLRQAVGFIKQAIQRSQARALRSVNKEVLSLYFGVGRYVSENSRHNMWGKGALKTISQELQKEIPGLTGFGETNLKDMRTFYEEWSPVVNRRPVADEKDLLNENQLLTEIRQPLADELNWTEFLQVPFTHHIIILRKIKNPDERIFYIHQCATRAWSKYALRDFIGQDLYKNRGNLPSNFTEAIPDTQLAIRTLKSFKESYLLGFINAEDLYESAEERTSPCSTSAYPTTYATSSSVSDKTSCSFSPTTVLSMAMKRSSSISSSSIVSSTVSWQ